MTNPIRLTAAADVLAAIPALLGFVPAQSVVTILLAQGSVVAGVRVDADAAAAAPRLAQVAGQHGATAALTVAIADARQAGAALRTQDAIRDAMTAAGITAAHALYIPQLVAGAAWTDLDSDETGICPDPQSSIVRAANAVQGRTVAATREDLAAPYVAGDVDEDARTAAREALADNVDDFPRATLTELAAVVERREYPSTDLAARVGLLITVDTVPRDAVMGLALIGADAAHDAMAAIARQLDADARIEALTLAGFFAYCAGNGPQARHAFDAAETTDGFPSRLGSLVSEALARGIHPDRIRTLAQTGVHVAASFGVDLEAR